MQWDLSPLYNGFDDENYSKDINSIIGMLENLGSWSETLPADPKNGEEVVHHYLKEMEAIAVKLENCNLFAELSFTVNTSDTTARTYMEQMEQLSGKIAPIKARFSAWLSHHPLDAKKSSDSLIVEHAFILEEMVESAKHMLSANEEQLLAEMKSTGSTAWGNLHGELTSKLGVEFPDGSSLPLSAARAKAYEADRNVRKEAYESEIKAYKKIEQPIAAALNGIKGEVITVAKKRAYDSPLDMTLKTARMDDAILDAMLTAMKEYMPKFHEYYKAKAHHVSGDNALPFYDMFAPIGTSSLVFTWDEARKFIVRHFGGFSKELAEYADNAFEKRWIDVLPKEGKVGGAFCAGAHEIGESRILVNFTGSYNDVRTVGHELGHGWHGHQLRKHSSLNINYPMTLAETASIFCETIINDGALSELPKDEQLAILEADISSSGQVIVDIYSRYLFETDLFAQRAKGSLSVDQMKEAMTTAQKAAYGDSLDSDTLHPYMWICKPHYYGADYNFYNFPYAFGLLFAKGLYAIYKKEGSSFVNTYNTLLKETGAMKAAEVAATVGIDLRDPEFWKGSLSVISDDIDRLVELLKS
ncbi:M3 family oligoendopeptidase [bacterium]|nr:M3 family oligoendopeptidase [bacterium]